jgi:hypothetical protein
LVDFAAKYRFQLCYWSFTIRVLGILYELCEAVFSSSFIESSLEGLRYLNCGARANILDSNQSLLDRLRVESVLDDSVIQWYGVN